MEILIDHIVINGAQPVINMQSMNDFYQEHPVFLAISLVSFDYFDVLYHAINYIIEIYKLNNHSRWKHQPLSASCFDILTVLVNPEKDSNFEVEIKPKLQ